MFQLFSVSFQDAGGWYCVISTVSSHYDCEHHVQNRVQKRPRFDQSIITRNYSKCTSSKRMTKSGLLIHEDMRILTQGLICVMLCPKMSGSPSSPLFGGSERPRP